MPEAVRIEVGQPSRRAGFLEYPANRISIAPAFPAEAGGAKSSVRPKCDSCCWEQRVIRTPEQLGSQILYPTDHDLPKLFSHGEKRARERLRKFRLHLARVLENAARLDVYVLELHRRDSPVASPAHEREGDEGLVAALDSGSSGHALNEVQDLFHGWHRLLASRLRYARLLFREVEVIGIRVVETRAIARLPRQPLEKRFERCDDGVEGRFAERFSGTQIELLGESALEALCLLDMESFEVPVAGVSLEPGDRLGDGVDRGVAQAAGVP